MLTIKIIYIFQCIIVVALSFHYKLLGTITLRNFCESNIITSNSIYYDEHTSRLSYNKNKYSLIRLSMNNNNINVNNMNNNINKNEVLSFGNTMKIQIKLPTRDINLANEFLNDPQYIVEQTWDRNRIKKITSTTFLLQFLAIPIPGIDVVTPEIEVIFENVNGYLIYKLY